MKSRHKRLAIAGGADYKGNAIERAFLDKLYYVQGKFPALATKHDYYMALAYTVRDRIMHRWLRSASTYYQQAVRSVCYFSAEFLLGPHLGNNLANLEHFRQFNSGQLYH